MGFNYHYRELKDPSSEAELARAVESWRITFVKLWTSGVTPFPCSAG